MSDKLKLERIDNGDGTITMRVTQDISEEVRMRQRKAERGELGVIHNIGPNNASVVIASPLNDRDFIWKKADE